MQMLKTSAYGLIWLLIVIKAIFCHGDACDGSDFGSSGDFDFYVFQQTWPAEFCNDQSYAGCEHPTPYMQSNLTLHGLWPNYEKSIQGHWWPQCCQSQYGPEINQTAVNLLSVPLHMFWPDEKNPDWPNYISSEFWDHEWGKHGTCSGLDDYDYLWQAISVHEVLMTPPVISSHTGSSVLLPELMVYYSGSSGSCPQGSPCIVGLNCSDGYLSDVTTCWTKAGIQRTCPWEVIDHSKCPDTIKIRSFQQIRDILK